ncbi:MAG: Xaa-Pro aminopeptidase [Clostridia bacterium]|nr:Xaa-Pro aminopeptidase [Clostridia bacterium]
MGQARISNLRRRMQEENIEALLVSAPENRFYLSGFTGDEGWLLVTSGKAFLITDRRFLEQAAAEAPNFIIVDRGDSFLARLGEVVAEEGIRILALEEDHVTFNFYRRVMEAVADPKSNLPKNLILKPASGLVEGLREIKEEGEIQLLRRAANLADAAFEYILSFLKPGALEIEIAAELEYFMRRKGAEGPAFPTIVASGPRSSLPHGRAGKRALQKGDLVVLDFGALFGGYNSDLTRTVVLGPVTPEQTRLYRTVRTAQELALQGLKAGLKAREADALARNYIESTDYAGRFAHGLGHGVGLSIHEGPTLSHNRETILQAGMVVTVEPGIYLPGWGGVRIEDMAVVEEDGCAILTHADKSLLVL